MNSTHFPHRLRPPTAAVLLLTLLGASNHAPADENRFTPRHVAKVASAAGPVISPNGRHIAFLKRVQRDPYAETGKYEPDYKDGGAYTELHVFDVDAGEQRPFITGRITVGRIDWTPDSKAISFLDKRGDDKHTSLYVIPVGGGEARRVLAHETSISSYAWHPDGEQVAFLATEKKPKKRKKLEDKGFTAEIYEEKLHPTHVWIAAGPHDDKPRKLDLPGSASELHWSHNGRYLAVALAPTPLIDDYYMSRKVHIVDAASGERVRKIDNPGKLGPVRWSPDGKHIAMISAADINDPAEGRLMVASVADGTLRELLPDFEAHVSAIAWQDNQTIMFLADEGCHTTLNEIGIDGNNRKTHVPAGNVAFVSFSLSNDGQRSALLGSSATFPYEVFYMAHGDRSPKRMTESNPWMADMRFAEQQVVEYTARDGLKLQGILIRPLDEEPGTRYPLILAVHGGPEAHERNGWLTHYSRPGQVAAAQGFAVFYPNYRGSTGRGVEFSKMGQADYAGAEFNDLVDAIDHLVKAGLVDEERVGITGGSYGGFASAWGATALSRHFAASVMFVGISDHISKAGTTDIPKEMNLVHARRWPWEGHWDWFRERSPLYHVKEARTPILIMHGKEDPRVHPSQSMMLYRYLKTIGEVPVRLVYYPGEGHGNRKASARLDYNLRMMRWMERYLKGPGGELPPPELDYGFDEDKKDESDENASDDAE